jgi:hypothetical protein
MTTASLSVSEDWEIDDGPYKPESLLIRLRRETYILPWFRFSYGHGTDDQVEIGFGPLLVTVQGHGLTALLDALSTHRVSRLILPTQNEAKFNVRGEGVRAYTGPAITSITVEEVEA